MSYYDDAIALLRRQHGPIYPPGPISSEEAGLRCMASILRDPDTTIETDVIIAVIECVVQYNDNGNLRGYGWHEHLRDIVLLDRAHGTTLANLAGLFCTDQEMLHTIVSLDEISHAASLSIKTLQGDYAWQRTEEVYVQPFSNKYLGDRNITDFTNVKNWGDTHIYSGLYDNE